MQAESCGGRRFLFLPATKGCQTEPPVVVGVGSVTDSPEHLNVNRSRRLETSAHGSFHRRGDVFNIGQTAHVTIRYFPFRRPAEQPEDQYGSTLASLTRLRHR